MSKSSKSKFPRKANNRIEISDDDLETRYKLLLEKRKGKKSLSGLVEEVNVSFSESSDTTESGDGSDGHDSDESDGHGQSRMARSRTIATYSPKEDLRSGYHNDSDVTANSTFDVSDIHKPIKTLLPLTTKVIEANKTKVRKDKPTNETKVIKVKSKKKKSKQIKQPKLEVKLMNLDDIEKTPIPRRSKRNRIPKGRLEYWRGERAIYKKEPINGVMCETLVGIQDGFH